jgi:hypothetical protein
VVDQGVLSHILLIFKQATEGWATALQPMCESLFFTFMQLGWAVLGFRMIMGGGGGSIIGELFAWIICQGFALSMIRYGALWLSGWYKGVGVLASMLGAPPFDPSAVASYGPQITAPLRIALTNSGFLSWALSPSSWLYSIGVWLIDLAFIILSFEMIAISLASYLVVASLPFFWCFFSFQGTRSLTLKHINLSLSTMAGLFIIMLMTCVVGELALLMETAYRAAFLAPGAAPGTSDYLGPVAVGLVLCAVFIWVPQQFIRTVGGFLPDWQGGFQLARMGMAGMGAAASIGSRAAQGRLSDTPSGGGRIAAPQTGAGSMQSAPAQVPASQWGWQK